MDIEGIKEKLREIALNLRREEILAVGLFGSLARGDFDERSDIDIFVITQKELTLREQDKLYFNFSESLSNFKRDITVLTYDINSLNKVPSWQTLNLLKDAHFVFDKGSLKEIFGMILKEAEKCGIVYDNEEKVFKLKRPGRTIFSLGEAR